MKKKILIFLSIIYFMLACVGVYANTLDMINGSNLPMREGDSYEEGIIINLVIMFFCGVALFIIIKNKIYTISHKYIKYYNFLNTSVKLLRVLGFFVFFINPILHILPNSYMILLGGYGLYDSDNPFSSIFLAALYIYMFAIIILILKKHIICKPPLNINNSN